MAGSLTFEDWIMAKILAEEDIVSGRLLRDFVRKLDRFGGRLDELIIAEGLLTPQRVEVIHRDLSRHLLELSQQVLAEAVRDLGVVEEETLRALKNQQRREDFSKTLTDMIREQGLAEEGLVVQAETQASAVQNKYKEEILEQAAIIDFSELHFTAVEETIQWLVEVPGVSQKAFQMQDTMADDQIGKLSEDDSEELIATEIMPQSQTQARLAKERIVSEIQKKFTGIVLNDRFQTTQLVGLGGMGAVFKARDHETGRSVAVKFIRDPNKESENYQRFEREVLIASVFRHPNVVGVHDAGEDEEGVSFLIMDFVAGDSLEEVLKLEGRIEAKRMFILFRELMTGLQYVHQLKIVHRDLKPANIMLAVEHQKETLKLTDFGLARALNRAQREQEEGRPIFVTVAGTVTGTPAYVAPETIRCTAIDERTDFYSLGVILFEMLTGHLPFTSTTKLAALKDHLFSEPALLSKFYPDHGFPDAVQGLISQMLAKEQAERPETCQAIIDTIDNEILPALD